MTNPEPGIRSLLLEANLIFPHEKPKLQPLEGGVSSDIWLVKTERGSFCVKRAREQLKVEIPWFAPVERNRYEVAWMQTANGIVQGITPQILSHDSRLGLFAMSYFEPDKYLNWRAMLMAGQDGKDIARLLGSALAKIHNTTAGRQDIKERFATDHIFNEIRLSPYLLTSAKKHPELMDPLKKLLKTTANTKTALVHGDISPKNILVGPENSPVILDAECAWYGDPAFDLAFCLKHFLLKTLWRPDAAPLYFSCFLTLTSTYLQNIKCEPEDRIHTRIANLLPGLLLGRIDGKSPIDYITAEHQKERVRRVAGHLLLNPVTDTQDILDAWTNSSFD